MKTFNTIVSKTDCYHPFEVTDKGKIRFDTYEYISFLQNLGFRRAKFESQYHYVHEQDNVITLVDKAFMVQTALVWLDKNQTQLKEDGIHIDDAKNALINKARQISEDSTLFFIKEIKINLVRDTETESYFFYTNTVIKVTKEGLTFIGYHQLHGKIMSEQILSREFTTEKILPENADIPFRKFIHNIADNDPIRIEAFESMIGYMLHRFQNPANVKAVFLLDSNINELELVEGGTGKSLLINSLSKMRFLCDIPGKDFSTGNPFAFQRVSSLTNIIAINDMKENLNFESMYGRISDGIAVNRKYKPEIYIELKDAPKHIFASNYYPKAPIGNSTDRRQYMIELSGHYNKSLTVYDEFGHYFFEGWSQEQWLYFDHYMLYCIQSYMKRGLINAPSVYLEERRLISEVGMELIEFMDEQLLVSKKLHKKELYKIYSQGGYVSNRFMPTQKTFTQRIKKYFEYKGIKYKETPANTKLFIEIISEVENITLATLEDVNVDYKIVDTSNKMTRLVNKLTEHFSNPKNTILALDLETTGLDPLTDDIVCLSLTFKEQTGYAVILPENRVKRKKLLTPLLPFLSNESIAKVFHNAKFDLKFLSVNNIEIKGKIWDTMILDYLIDPNRKTHGLKELSEIYLKYKQINFKELTEGKSIRETPADLLTHYACEDTDQTLQLYHYLTEQLTKSNI